MKSLPVTNVRERDGRKTGEGPGAYDTAIHECGCRNKISSFTHKRKDVLMFKKINITPDSFPSLNMFPDFTCASYYIKRTYL